nr:hypothetical protein [Proteiniphilum sp. UBA4988]
MNKYLMDMKKYFLTTVLFVCLMLFAGCQDRKLRNQIADDKRLESVVNKAEEFISTGLNAGGHYNEIWIRDLNTFLELACDVGRSHEIREALLMFFHFQKGDGDIPDGYVPKEKANGSYDYRYSDSAPGFMAHKNTVETDQETSLVQAVAKYIRATGDTTILQEKINGLSVLSRMEKAMYYLLDHRYSDKYGLLWGATTIDWGDVQPEHEWGVCLDSTSHLCVDIYDNAMFIIAIKDLLSVTTHNKEFWSETFHTIFTNVRIHLWDEKRQKFIPHLYLDKSPFTPELNELEIYYHGGTAIAIEAGLLSKKEIISSYKKMKENVEKAGAQSIGLTIYPFYPIGFFNNPILYECGDYGYQNGGDWTWFGARMVKQLARNGFYAEAYEAISPMLDRTIAHDGFYEWWSHDGEPKGSGAYRGTAGVLWSAIKTIEEYNQ